VHKTPRGPEKAGGLLDLLSTHWDHQTATLETALFEKHRISVVLRPSCTQGYQAVDTFVDDIKCGTNTVQEFLVFQSPFSNMLLGQLELDLSQHSRQS